MVITHKTDLSKVQIKTELPYEIFRVIDIQKRLTKANKSYYDLKLGNKLSFTWVKDWDILSPYLKKGVYIEAKLEGVDHPQYGTRWNLVHYVISNYVGDSNYENLIRTVKNPELLLKEMLEFTYTNYTIQQLRDNLNSDISWKEKFCTLPASKQNHHSMRSGLVLHTYEVWNSCKTLLENKNLDSIYGNINKDITLFGALIHDISKVNEYEWVDFPECTKVKPTLINGLLNNTVAGVEEIEKRAIQIHNFGITLDPNIIIALKHIIVSHHTKYSWRSPVPPMTPEAMLVASMDSISCVLENYKNAISENKSDDDLFTSTYYFYNPNGEGGTRLLKPQTYDPNYGK